MIEKLNARMWGYSQPEGTGVVTVSGEKDTTSVAWKAFDGRDYDATTAWISNTPNGWIAYEFPAPKIVTQYTIQCYNDAIAGPPRAPRDWTLEAWDDKQVTPVWVVLDTQAGQTSWIAGLKRTYNITNTTAYKKYRINCTANNGDGSYVAIAEIELFGIIDRTPNPGDIHYYVSQQRGNDNNDGLTQATAWATITKAATTVQANVNGDAIVHIGPGTYRERPVHSYGGTDGVHRIIFAGDPDCVYLTGDKPGVIRVTGCAADTELPSGNEIINYNSKTYLEWRNVYVDGCAYNKYPLLGNSGIAAQIARNVKVNNYYGFNYLTCYNCQGIGVRPFNYCTCFNCISIAGDICYSGSSSLYNCIGIGGASFSNTSGTVAYNCIAIGQNGTAFANTTHYNCYAAGTYTAAGGTSTNLKSWWNATTADSPPPIMDFDINVVFKQGMADKGINTKNTTASADYIPYVPIDLVGAPRYGGDTTIDIGPWELPDYSLDWNNYKSYAPSIRINGAGQLIFKFPVEAGKPVIKSAFIKSYILTDFISQMSSNSGAEGTASASTEGQPAWKAFNKTTTDTSDCWSTSNTVLTGWLQYQFTSPKVIRYYSITPQNDTNGVQRAPKTWTFKGSLDGVNWTILDTQTNITGWVLGSKKEYQIANETSYSYYRLDVTAIGTATDYLAIGELNMSGSAPAPSNYDESLKPMIIVRGLGMAEKSAAPSVIGDFSQTVVYFSPTVTGVMELALTTRDSSYGSYSLFSDII